MVGPLQQVGVDVVVSGERMAVGHTTTCAISAYQHSSRGVLDTTLCDKV